MSMKKFDEAAASFKEAVRSDPGRPGSYCNLGTALFNQGLLDDAINAYGKALTVDPWSKDALYNLGITFIRKEMYAEALKAFEEFLSHSGMQDSRIEKAKGNISKLKEYLSRSGRR